MHINIFDIIQYFCRRRSELVHGVLVVEQLLTTGGGWQDQVGGLHPGLNLGTSAASPQVLVLVTVSRVHTLYCTVCRWPW